MSKQTPVVEWYMAESDADWLRLRVPPVRHRTPSAAPAGQQSGLVQQFLWEAVAILLLLASAGGWWWYTTQSRAHQAATSVTATAQNGLDSAIPGNDSLFTSVISDQTAVDWRRQRVQADSNLPGAGQSDEPSAAAAATLHRIGFQGDQAVVSIITTAKNGVPMYRQTRFYRRTASGWQPTAPDAALWGSERSLETPSFVFHFRQNDAPAVIVVASQIDALYATLWRNFGLPIIPTPEKLDIDVSVAQLPGQAARWFDAPNRILVPSPAVYGVPGELTDTELLAQSIALPLIADVLTQASEHHTIAQPWQPMMRGLYLWQVWDLELPLAGWQEDVVTRLYADLPATRPDQAIVLPERYTAHCAAHIGLLSSPVRLDIPLVCAELTWEDFLLSPWGWHEPLTRLDQLVVPLRPGEYIEESDSLHSVRHPSHTLALATLIEYAVATYGRERLPTLLAGLGHYESWDTLLPAVFDISAAEFEAGWQNYLTMQYGLSTPFGVYQIIKPAAE